MNKGRQGPIAKRLDQHARDRGFWWEKEAESFSGGFEDNGVRKDVRWKEWEERDAEMRPMKGFFEIVEGLGGGGGAGKLLVLRGGKGYEMGRGGCAFRMCGQLLVFWIVGK